MRFKIILAYIILLLIPVAGFFCHKRVECCCDETAEYITSAQGSLSDSKRAAEINSALNRWKKDEWFLTSFITHEEVDAVTIALVRSLALSSIDDEEELTEVLSECLAHMEVVKNFDRLSVRSIF